MSDLRARNRAATAERMLDAVQQVLAEEHPATLSMPRVAGRAGVSLRTLYRYFPTKESLVDAASNTLATEPAAAAGGTPAGRELRARRLPRSRAHILTSSTTSLVELVDRLGHREDDAARLAAWATEAVVDRARREGGVAR